MITTEQAVQEKSKVEGEIVRLLKELEARTGCMVSGVDVNIVRAESCGGELVYCLVRCRVDLEVR